MHQRWRKNVPHDHQQADNDQGNPSQRDRIDTEPLKKGRKISGGQVDKGR